MGGVEGSVCKEFLNCVWIFLFFFICYVFFEDYFMKLCVWFLGWGNIFVCGVVSMCCFEIINFRSLMIFEDVLFVYDVEILNNCCSEFFYLWVIIWFRILK